MKRLAILAAAHAAALPAAAHAAEDLISRRAATMTAPTGD